MILKYSLFAIVIIESLFIVYFTSKMNERMDKLERVYNNISSPVDRVYYIKHFTDHHLLI